MCKKLLFAVGIALTILAACQKENGTEDPTEQSVVEEERPTEDAFSIKTDIETKVYGNVSDKDVFGKSFTARLTNRVAAFDDNTTKLCVITGDAITANHLPQRIIWRYTAAT